MLDLINLILEIDEDARKNLETAYQTKNKIIEEAKKSEESIKAEALEQAMKRIEKVEVVEKQDSEEKIEIIKKQTEELRTKLENMYEQNHAQWESEIVNNILN